MMVSLILKISRVMALLVIILGAILGVATAAIDLKAICDSTLYPNSCHRLLAQIDVANVGLREVYKLSVKVTIDEVLRTSNGLLKLEKEFKNVSSNPNSFRALKFCREMLSIHAIARLNDSLAVLSDKRRVETFDDLKTWLSAAGIYHENCIDAFADSEDAKLRSLVLLTLENSKALASNTLNILHAFEKFVQTADNSNKRLNRKLRWLMGETPSWFSHRDRKLLERPLKNTHVDLVVAKDGSGNFKTIGEAINAAPFNCPRRFVIYVKAGVYYEVVKVVEFKNNIMMIGDGMERTIVSGNLCPRKGVDCYDSATFAVWGQGFIASDMGFENTAGAEGDQAVALRIDGDKGVFYRCKIAGYQDTLLANCQRQYFRDCEIYGTVDFIFGYSEAIFMNTKILPRKPLVGQQNVITAQGKYNATVQSGFSFIGCTISPAEDLTGVYTYLGRPWKDYSTTVFMYTHMDSLIDPQGWIPYSGSTAPNTIFYGEYENTGPGAATNNRVRHWRGYHKTMKRSQVNQFTVNAFIKGNEWIPSNVPSASMYYGRLPLALLADKLD